MITSAGLHALHVKDQLYKKKMKISHAKHKLKGFTRALMASGSNLKYYFKQKADADANAAMALRKEEEKDTEDTGDGVPLGDGTHDNDALEHHSTLGESDFHRCQCQRNQKFLQLCTKYNILPEPIEITLEAPPLASPHAPPDRPLRKRKVLRISHRSLSNDMIIALAESLSNNAVDDIYALGNSMLESGLCSLIQSQMGTTSLTVLDASRNVLEKFLPQTTGPSDTGGCRNPGTHALKAFFLTTSPTNILSVDGQRDGPYPSCPLVVLNLSSMKLGDVRGEYLAKSLSAMPNLKSLDLSNNQLSTKTGHSLVPFPSLEVLDVSWNLFGGRVLTHLFLQVVDATPTLLDLRLQGNSVGSWSQSKERRVGMDSICTFVVRNKTLRHVDLSHNMLDRAFGAQLNVALLSNHTLMGVHCVGNKFRMNANGNVVVLDHGFQTQTGSEGGGNSLSV